jgi:hypothetical protein
MLADALSRDPSPPEDVVFESALRVGTALLAR